MLHSQQNLHPFGVLGYEILVVMDSRPEITLHRSWRQGRWNMRQRTRLGVESLLECQLTSRTHVGGLTSADLERRDETTGLSVDSEHLRMLALVIPSTIIPYTSSMLRQRRSASHGGTCPREMCQCISQPPWFSDFHELEHIAILVGCGLTGVAVWIVF